MAIPSYVPVPPTSAGFPPTTLMHALLRWPTGRALQPRGVLGEIGSSCCLLNPIPIPKTASNMPEIIMPESTRRDFLRQTSAAALSAGVLSAGAYAAGDDTIKVGLIGCGGRGSGAARQALSTK